ncbi:carbohydrate esterase family 9 protein [Moniliophthora roreri MCA 2997]|uniref:Carbohydrate esterase family 9 protein n=1 Tax=Moniliophthora roreri (strain MCA 2997) TaxID=1381753 RepID=V2X229_MONRO|nr:carbohydrate esterase family 9 protein [Moniliophthora roreri MCA 2997]
MFGDEKGTLPVSTHRPRQRRHHRFLILVLLLCPISLFSYLYAFNLYQPKQHSVTRIPINAQQLISKCAELNTLPSPPPDFHNRTVSDRFDAPLAPKKPILIRNATIWTGEVAEGLEIVFGDVLFDKGVIRAVGPDLLTPKHADVIEANGAWLTAGIVDLHSHLGVSSSPSLSGASDTNSQKQITQPWLRSLDGLNTHDEAYRLSISGGVTTAVVLPGSANAIGGQAFPIKLRQTSLKSSSSMLLEPPFDVNGTRILGRWRQLKQACGENPSRVYNGVRMDTIWSFRAAYEEARQLKVKQDAFCEKVAAGNWAAVQAEGDFPDDLQWEALVDVLRGKVKIQNHCYEAVDLDGLIRLTNEFNFSIAAFHHAHEAYLVPGLLRQMYGHTPGIAMFATHGRYKREAYRGSEFAPRVLADESIDVVLKSDHPVTNSRYLLNEAQQAFYYGLPASLALASVTTTPAKIAGLDHRVGKVKAGWDADLVIWDSHPLTLSATPIQVFIDGIPQLSAPSSIAPSSLKHQTVPKTPNWDVETAEAVKFNGLPPLEGKVVGKVGKGGKGVVFEGVGSVYVKRNGKIIEVFSSERAGVLVENGRISCVQGVRTTEFRTCIQNELQNAREGYVKPGLTNYGSPLGLVHIDGEASTQDHAGTEGVVRAVDGLLFESRNALIAHRSGATLSITPPLSSSSSILAGISTLLSTGASNKLAQGAVVKNEVALHASVSLSRSGPGVSSQIRTLRRGLLGQLDGEQADAYARVVNGSIPLIIEAHSADIIASLITLKSEVEKAKQTKLKFVLAGATEAHLLAEEIGSAGIGVVVQPSRPFPDSWQDIRLLPGPPLSKKTAIQELLEHNVTVAVGIGGPGDLSRKLRWDIGWVALDSEGAISTADALSLASTNIDTLFGLSGEEVDSDLVAVKGGNLLQFEGKVVGVVSQRRGVVEVFE